MRMLARGPGAGWSWLLGGFTVARRNPGAVFGAAALFTLCMAVIMALQLIAERTTRNHGTLLVLVATSLVFGMLTPVLTGGFLRVLDASHHQRPASAWMLFDPFRPGGGGIRLALFGLGMVAIYTAFLALLLSTVGHGVWPWYRHLIEVQASGTPMTGWPAPPAGIGTTGALLVVFFIFYSGALAVGTGQAALRNLPPVQAVRDGIAGAFRNALPLVVLTVCGLLAFVAAAIVVGILAAIIAMLGMLMGPAMGVVLMVPISVAFVLLLYAFVMGVNYAIWRDVADAGHDDAGPASLPETTG